MRISKTFDEIFDQLHNLYKGEWVQIQVKKDGLTLSDFSTLVQSLEIKPMEDQKVKRQLGLKSGEKIGSIMVMGSNSPKGHVSTSLNIPFVLGFDTMDAHFVKTNVIIETCGFEFALRKLTSSEVRSLSA